MPRKVFISFLGFSNYGACYYCKGDYKSAEVRYVQEATLEYLTRQEKWGADSLALILLTAGAEAKNWEDNGHRDRDTNEVIKQTGLRTQLERMQLPFEVRPVRGLPDGNNEQEIWTIFSRIFDELEEGDELYFDLTHGFRYLPMLVLVLGNYAKFLKRATVRHISYGNFEGRNRTTNEAPLIDLLPLTQLQDWTFAAANYLQNGYSKDLKKIANLAVRTLLKESAGKDRSANSIRNFANALDVTTNERLMCRGIDIIQSSSFAKLKKLGEEAKQAKVVAPLHPIIQRINDSFSDFSENCSVRNGIAAAKWCFANNLYQQAITILHETIITFICYRKGLDWKLPKERDLVNKAFNIDSNKTPEAKWQLGYSKTEEEHCKKIEAIKNLLSDEALQRLSSSFVVSTNIRNDFNHAGMRNNPSTVDKLRMLIEQRIAKVEEITTEFEDVSKANSASHVPHFINLTNHPLEAWSDEQLAAASTYGEAVDYPFPAVAPAATEEDIAATAAAIVADITARYGTECTVHLMGEFTMTAALLQRFQQRGIVCVASTTERIVSETEPGKKVVEFKFVKFRKYS